MVTVVVYNLRSFDKTKLKKHLTLVVDLLMDVLTFKNRENEGKIKIYL